MDVFVPFDALDPKSRLEPPLSTVERIDFAHAMLTDVLDAVEAAGHDPTVLSTAPMDIDAAVLIDERPLSKAVNSLVDLTEDPVAVVMADLPLATPGAIEGLLTVEADVVLAPGIGGGTNALVIRDGAFTADFHGSSFADHRAIAEAAGLEVRTVDSFTLGLDIAEPADLPEVIIPSDRSAAGWLADRGFVVEADDTGRVRAVRRPDD